MERTIVNRIVRELKARGHWVMKVHGSPLQVRGVPDLLACVRGRFVALEVKDPHGDPPTALQLYTIDQIRAAGGIAAVVTSLEEVLALLE